MRALECGVQPPELSSSVVATHGLSCLVAYRILALQPGMKPASSALLQGGFLTTGPPGKSLDMFFNVYVFKPIYKEEIRNTNFDKAKIILIDTFQCVNEKYQT